MNLDEYYIKLYWDNMSIIGIGTYTDDLYELLSHKTIEKAENKTKEIALRIVKKVIENGESVEEYCAKFGGSINRVKSLPAIIKKSHLDIYKQFEICRRKPSEAFYEYIRSVAQEMIINENNFDIFDYYCLTKLHPVAFKNFCKKVLSQEEMYKIEHYLTKFKVIEYIPVNFEAELNGITIINNYEISREEKLKIAQYLIENNMPYATFKFALRKYVAGDERLTGYVNQPQKKKGDKLYVE